MYNKYCSDCISLIRRENNWKGGKYIDTHGYVNVLDKRKSHLNGASRYSLEHRLVMEKKLGRDLKNNEIVHHLNGIRDDNRIVNLELIKKTKGKSNHETWTLQRATAEKIVKLEKKLKRLKSS